MDVDDTHCGASIQTALYELVICSEIGAVQRSAELIVDEVLPGDWETEGIQSVVGYEVLHLCVAIGWWRGRLQVACSISRATKVKPSDILRTG